MIHSLSLTRTASLVLALGLLGHTPTMAGDWPAFGGPDADFTATASPALATDWTASPPQELWADTLGEGFGGAAIADGRVYVMDRLQAEENALRCLDLATGEEIWRYSDPIPGRIQYPGSRGVPTVTETHVYAIGPFGNAYCVERARGDFVWKIDQVEQYGGQTPRFGYAQSPLVVGDKIILAPLGPEHSLIAVDAMSGELAWSLGGLLESHSTPNLIKLLGDEYIVFNTATREAGRIVGVQPETGEVAWSYDGYPIMIAIPTPIPVGDDRLFITGGYGAGSKMIRAKRGEAGIDFEEIFSLTPGAQIHRPILYDDHIYMVANEGARPGRGRGRSQEWNDGVEIGLACIDLNGKIAWSSGTSPNFGRGGLLRIDKLLLVQDGHSGVLRLAKASPEGYMELASYNTFSVADNDDHQMWAPLAMSGSKLIARSQDKLVCLQLPTAE